MNQSEQIENQLRLKLLLVHCEKILRQNFRQLYQKDAHAQWEDTKKFGEKFASSHSSYLDLGKKQRQKLCDGNVTGWDMTLLGKILNHVKLGRSDTKMKLDKTNMDNLLNVRNTYSHAGDDQSTANRFDDLWSQASTAIQYFEGDEQEIQKLLTRDLAESFNSDDFEYSDKESMTKSRKCREDCSLAMERGHFSRAIEILNETFDLVDGISSVEKGLLFTTRSYLYLKAVDNSPEIFLEEKINETLALALEDAHTATSILPTWRMGYYRAGQVYQFKKEWASAITSYNQALGLDPIQGDMRMARDECRFEENLEKNTVRLIRHPLFFRTDNITNITPNSITIMEALMSSNDPMEQSRGLVFMAKLHFHGFHVPKVDYKKSMEFFEKAALLNNNPDAIFCLGLHYQFGYGVPRNFEKAAQLFEQAATFPMDNPNNCDENRAAIGLAQFALGGCYGIGVGRPLDDLVAAKWYAHSANNGCVQAAYHHGTLYQNGQGVPRNRELGIQGLTGAAHGGNKMAMERLTTEFMREGNFDEANKWFAHLIKDGALPSSSKDKKLADYYSERTTMANMYLHVLGLDRETASFSPFEAFAIADKLAQAVGPTSQSASHQSFPSPQHQSPECSLNIDSSRAEIYRKAAEGSKYAACLQQALIFFDDGLALLTQYEPGVEEISEKIEQILDHLAQSFRIFPMAISDEEKTKLKAVVDLTLKKTKHLTRKTSKMDLDARICSATLKLSGLEKAEVAEFARMSQKMYPDEPFFHEIYHFSITGSLEEREAAVEKSLQKFPEKSTLLFTKLGYAVLHDDDAYKSPTGQKLVEKVHSIHSSFLKVTPPDDYFVPESYYLVAEFLIKNWTNSILQECVENSEKINALAMSTGPRTICSEAIKFYEMGLASESNLVACFLPYPSAKKSDIKSWIEAFNEAAILEKSGSHGNVPIWQKSVVPVEDRNVLKTNKFKFPLENPETDQRIKIVRDYRAKIRQVFLGQKINIAEFLNFQDKIKQQITTIKSVTTNVTNNICVFLRIKFIMLEDLICLRLENGFALIDVITIDEGGNWNRCIFLNVGNSLEEMKRNLQFGSLFHVNGPTITKTEDGSSLIIIEQPEMVEFLQNGGTKCRFCGNKNPTKTCTGCRKAMYCNERCQSRDWRALKHKYICGKQSQ